jgi:hypothetical protein
VLAAELVLVLELDEEAMVPFGLGGSNILKSTSTFFCVLVGIPVAVEAAPPIGLPPPLAVAGLFEVSLASRLFVISASISSKGLIGFFAAIFSAIFLSTLLISSNINAFINRTVLVVVSEINLLVFTVADFTYDKTSTIRAPGSD